MKTQHFIYCLAIAAVLFTACKKDKAQEQGIPVTGVTLNQTELMLEVGDTATLIATVEPADATNKTVIWTSSNSAVATVNDNGLITAIIEGDVTIAVTTEDGKKTATCDLIVVKRGVPVTGVTLNQTELMLDLGDTATLIATVEPDSATNKNVTWISNNTSVATVNGNGLITAIDKGDATITVTTEDGKKTTTCLITVRDYREKWIGEYIGEYTLSWSLMGGSGSYTEIIVISVSVSADSCLFIENVKYENYTPKIYTDGYFEQKDASSWYICKGVMLNDSIVFSGTPGHSPSGTTSYIYNGKKQ